MAEWRNSGSMIENSGGMLIRNMHGTFNGLPIKRIIGVTSSKDAPGFTRTAFRVLGGANPKLEERLCLGDEATLILSSVRLMAASSRSRETSTAATRSPLNRRNPQERKLRTTCPVSDLSGLGSVFPLKMASRLYTRTT